MVSRLFHLRRQRHWGGHPFEKFYKKLSLESGSDAAATEVSAASQAERLVFLFFFFLVLFVVVLLVRVLDIDRFQYG